MNESNIILPALGIAEWNILWIVLGSAFVAILYGIYLCWNVLRQDPGSAKMQEVAKAIEEGAMAYLGQQFRMMSWIIIPLTIALFAMYRKIYAGDPSLEWIPLGVALSFLMGVLASYGAGFVGMWLAVKGNVRSANAALKSFKASMELAFRAGAVSGLFTVGFGLLGATIIFIIFREHVGGDLVGKVEVGIPEDDPRNAATIADNVGDNVGDCGGMAADVFESYEVTLVAAIILASATLLDPNFKATYGANASSFALMLIFFPLLLRAVGVFSSILGIWSVKVKEGSQMKDRMLPINIGYWVSSLSSVLGFAIVTFFYLKNPNTGLPDWRFFWATTIGIVLALLTLWITNYFTHPDKRPVMETATATKTGAATTILSGMAEGMESTVWAIVTIGATGLLTTTGYILAMDTYGPITDNAHGIFEMSGIEQEKEAAKTLAWMDAIGNTTKALTKGLAIATAVLAAIALFRSFIDEAHLAEIGIQINMPKVFVGLLLGAAVPFLFSAFAIKAVGRAAFGVVEEVRRQFREHPGIMEGQEKPDYARCVSIVTGMAQKELLGPGILAIFSPILVAFSLGAAPLGGFLGGAIVTGQLLAVYMANAGANWDNAKKKIEDGYLGGKGTESHKAAVIGDTVGDPYKDTAGPALNPMIKVMNLVGILVAPFAIRDFAIQVRIMIVLVCASFLLLAVLFSRRGGLATLK